MRQNMSEKEYLDIQLGQKIVLGQLFPGLSSTYLVFELVEIKGEVRIFRVTYFGVLLGMYEISNNGLYCKELI